MKKILGQAADVEVSSWGVGRVNRSHSLVTTNKCSIPMRPYGLKRGQLLKNFTSCDFYVHIFHFLSF